MSEFLHYAGEALTIVALLGIAGAIVGGLFFWFLSKLDWR